MYRYYLLNRPPDLYTHPAGFASQTAFNFLQDIPGDLFNASALGWVEYPEPLDFPVIWKYELLPADPTERNQYRWWFHCDRDTEEAEAMKADYTSQHTEWLKKDSEHNTYSALALETLEILYNPSQICFECDHPRSEHDNDLLCQDPYCSCQKFTK